MQHKLRTGDRIRLLSMPDDPDPVPVGALGTVVRVRDYGAWSQVDVAWDNGRSLMLSMPDDCVAIVTDHDRQTL